MPQAEAFACFGLNEDGTPTRGLLLGAFYEAAAAWINDNPEQVTDEIGDSFEEATLAVTEYMASGQAGVDRLGAEGKEADPALEQELLELLEIAEEKVNALVARINDRLSEPVTIPVNVTVAEAEQAQMAALAQLGR